MEYVIKDITWRLNPDENVVNAIVDYVENNNGCCGIGKKCPCSDYIDGNCCECNLYVRKNINMIVDEVSQNGLVLDGYNLVSLGEDIKTIA